jgi:hypothetical protein
MAKHTDFRRDRWNAQGPHRCGNYATCWRDGYQLCWQHAEQANEIRYSPDAHRFRRVHEYGAMMAVALGDVEPAPPPKRSLSRQELADCACALLDPAFDLTKDRLLEVLGDSDSECIWQVLVCAIQIARRRQTALLSRLPARS